MTDCNRDGSKLGCRHYFEGHEDALREVAQALGFRYSMTVAEIQEYVATLRHQALAWDLLRHITDETIPAHLASNKLVRDFERLREIAKTPTSLLKGSNE